MSSCRCTTTRSRRISGSRRISSTWYAASTHRLRCSSRLVTGPCSMRRRGPVAERPTRALLATLGLPNADLHALPDSPLRFPDGAHYRVEIPSTEGPRPFRAALDEAARLDVPVVRVSQGSGVFMHTDAELDE